MADKIGATKVIESLEQYFVSDYIFPQNKLFSIDNSTEEAFTNIDVRGDLWIGGGSNVIVYGVVKGNGTIHGNGTIESRSL